MDIKLSQLVPEPLKEQLRQGSEIWACEQVLPAKSRVFVSAASGKGKTTLQHLLYGLRRDYQGEAYWGERGAKDFSLEDWATLRSEQVSVVFQDLRLFGHLTARENLHLKNQLTDFCTEAEILAYCQALDIDNLLERPAGLLSYGQRQRFAIVRALCQPFLWLLLDEPFAHLDRANMEQACALIEQACNKQGAGLVLASLGERYALNYTKELSL